MARAAGIAGVTLLVVGFLLIVLGAFSIIEFERTHHIAMLVGGIPLATVGGLVLWIRRFGIN